MDRIYKRFLDRNVLFAMGVLPPPCSFLAVMSGMGWSSWPASSPVASRSRPGDTAQERLSYQPLGP